MAEDEHLPPDERMPLSKPVARRRLRSVIQDLIYLAAKLWHHSNRWGLALWQNSPWRGVWQRVYRRFCGKMPVRSG